MDKERVWIKDENENIYYCEIKSVSENELFGLKLYEVYPIIGCFNGFTTLINGVLTSPTICSIWIEGRTDCFGKVCYDLNRLINDGK